MDTTSHGAAVQGRPCDAGSELPRRRSESTGRYLVLLGDGSPSSTMSALGRQAGMNVASSRDFEGGNARLGKLGGADAVVFDTLGVAVVNAEPGQMGTLSAAAESRGSILAIEPERVVYATAVNHRGSLGENPQSEPEFTWGLQMTQAHRSKFTGRGIRVAVLDTGLAFDHPDFAGRAIEKISCVPPLDVGDVYGHGTHCCGTAAGGIHPIQPPRYGVAPEIELYVGTVLDDSGRGVDQSILAGIEWAIRSGCRIVSMSLGGSVLPGEKHSRVYEQAARRARRQGALLVAAAGNDSDWDRFIAPVSHPANCPSILAVGAVDSSLRVAPFSNRGSDPDSGQIDIAAPGVGVLSSWPLPAQYRSADGTSMATPHVAGIAALHAEAHPGADATALADLLVQTARRLPLSPADVGAGLVQAPI